MMARRMMRKHHVRCRAGEKVEITSKPYLSLCIVIECGNALLKHGYTIKIFNTINFQKSMHYNRATCSSLKRRRTALFQSVL
mgnify:CR=1 FL=1